MSHLAFVCGIIEAQFATKQLQKLKEFHPCKKQTFIRTKVKSYFIFFGGAGSSKKVMCVAMDYAKNDHLVLFLNGHGDIVRKPFSVINTPEGIAYIDDKVTRFCRRRGIEKKHVFFGGEDGDMVAFSKMLSHSL